MPDPFFLFRFWPHMLLATVILIPAMGAGWTLADYRRFPLVRALSWWLRLVLPRIKRPGWLSRTLLIFFNNGAVLALTLAGGFYWPVAVALIALLGVSLGIGMSLFMKESEDDLAWDAESVVPWRVRLGFALNMLEPPAIVTVLGLTLGQTAMPLPPETIWMLFGCYILPVLLLAAAGESFWIEELV